MTGEMMTRVIYSEACLSLIHISLARLMKNVSKGTAAQIPLKEELDLVKDYFLIQQLSLIHIL